MPKQQPMSRFEPIRKPIHYLIYILMLTAALAISALLMRLF